LWYVFLQAYDMFLLCCFHTTTFFSYSHFKSKLPCANSCLLLGVCVFFSYCVHWIMLCLLTYALHVLLWFLYYMSFVLWDIGWWKWIITFGCLSKSMKVFELLCLSIATIWMKLNLVIWIHHWMKLNVMYIHWVKLTFCVTFNFGFSKIFRIKEPRVLSKILQKPSLFSQNNEQITFPSFIKAYLTIFRFCEICDYRSKLVFRFWVIVVVYFEIATFHFWYLTTQH
jgi:hypothetical protein